MPSDKCWLVESCWQKHVAELPRPAIARQRLPPLLKMSCREQIAVPALPGGRKMSCREQNEALALPGIHYYGGAMVQPASPSAATVHSERGVLSRNNTMERAACRERI